ncbi:MAG: DinB family protein [Acidobacteria bacterium]|nr:DinB family protein [Acidobacteriota bacterium]
MNLIEPILMEFSYEAHTTRRMLERVPEEHLAWKPHEKSMSLARLATHIAEIPGWVGAIVNQDEFVIGVGGYTPPTAGSVAEILDMFDNNVAAVSQTLQDQTNEHLLAPWRLKKGDQVLVEMPRLAMIRTLLLSHIIHHRGQLSVYLRLHDVPLPPVYGPTADEGF